MSFENIQRSILPAKTNSLAPRQGLVFDGTAGTTGTAVTIGTADLTFSQWVRVPSTVSETRGLFLFSPAGSIGATSLLGYLDSDATLNIHITGATSGDRTKQTLSGFVTSYAGKWVNILFTRVGSTWTGYINGVATTFSASTSGTAPTWAGSISGAVVNFGSLGSSGAIYNDAISAINLYNRALSASEVVALYEAGAPSGGDYNSASNTAINSSAWVNTNYTSFSGASATGFTAVKASSTGYAESRPTFSIQKGQKFRFTGTLTLNNGKTVLPYVLIQEDATAVQIPASGSFDVTVTAGITMSGATAYFRTSGDADYTVSNVSVTRLGLLLAPDAAQAGGGLTWYDTSGNAANITLPASGVSWNVPSSRVLGGNWTTSGNLTVSGRDLTLGSSESVIYFGTPSANYLYYNGSSLFLRVGSVDRITIPASTGNVLIGTTTDGGQKLQVSGTAAFSGAVTATGGVTTAALTAPVNTLAFNLNAGQSLTFSNTGPGSGGKVIANQDLAFGANTSGSLYLLAGNSTALTLDSSQNATFAGKVTSTDAGYTNSGYEITNTTASRTTGWFMDNLGTTILRDVTGAADLLSVDTSGNATFVGDVKLGAGKVVYFDGGLNTYIQGSSGTLFLGTNGSSSLSIDSSKNATFAGTNVTVDGASTGSTLTLKRASNANGAIISYKTTTTSKWYHGLRGLVDDNWYLQNDVAGNTALFFDASTSNATFAGTLTLPNDKAIYFKEVGGTAQRFALNSGDVIYIEPDQLHKISIGGAGVTNVGVGGIGVAGNSVFGGSIVNQNGVIQSTLAAGALISSLSTNNNAVHGFQISGTGTGTRDWRLEQCRGGANSFSISNLTGGVTTPLIVNGATDNILIGYSSTTSDGGQKLQVNGNATFAGAISVAASAADAKIDLKRTAATNSSYIRWLTGSSQNWVIGTGATGNDTNLTFYSYDGGGSALILASSTGNATFGGNINAGGANNDADVRLHLNADGDTSAKYCALWRNGSSNKVFHVKADGDLYTSGPATIGGALTVSGGGTNVINGPSAAITTSGSGVNGTLRLTESPSSGAMLMMGTHGGNYAYVQMTNSSNLAAAYPIALNPNGGNVGIGTTTPGAQLEIGGTNPEIRLGPVSSSSGAYMSYNTAGNYFSLNAVTQGVGYRKLVFANDGGNVLIGTTIDGGQKLQVSGTIAASLGVSSNGALAAYPAANSAAMDWYGGYARFWGVGADASTAGGIKLIVSSTDGSPAVDALTIVSSGDATFAGRVTVNGTDGLLVNKSASLSVITMGEAVAGSYSRFNMRTGSDKYAWSIAAQDIVDNALTITPSTAVGGTTFTTPVFTLAQSGNATFAGTVTTSTTNTSQSAGNGNKLISSGGVWVVNAATNDAFSYYNSSASAYRFYVDGGGTISATNTAISAISDARLKENVRDLSGGLSSILALKPRVFDWKEGKGANKKNVRGFIAQEIEQVFPDLVDEWKDPAPDGESPYKSVRQDLIPVLVKAIQELKAEIDALKATRN